MELYIPPQRPTRNKLGRFVKNHPSLSYTTKPHSEQTKNNISKGLKKAFKEGRVKPPKYKGKQVIAVKDGKLLGCFESATKLAQHFKVNKVNIIRVCNKKRNSFRGMLFFYESDREWLKYIKQRT